MDGEKRQIVLNTLLENLVDLSVLLGQNILPEIASNGHELGRHWCIPQFHLAFLAFGGATPFDSRPAPCQEGLRADTPLGLGTLAHKFLLRGSAR